MIEQTPPNTKLQISKAFWVKYCESFSNQVFPKLSCGSTEEVELTKSSDGKEHNVDIDDSKEDSDSGPNKIRKTSPYDNLEVKLRAHQLRGNGNLYIPVAIANSWFEKKAQIVSLWVGEEYWHVNLTINKGSSSSGLEHRFSSGWAAFARDNSLQKSDVCIFELINKNQPKIKVTIFRQSKSSMTQQ
ncbi:hypothetical protein G4B88_002110 [Cannabis sativa]|uniref:TF-B3 domain-containing protein n=1 Tax=Cannabis sativa TaxID=3483 RepID=A0A7J6EY36_CANSA|nr:hypothetical protein G4B88_002110 [Cannabis sativa]